MLPLRLITQKSLTTEQRDLLQKLSATFKTEAPEPEEPKIKIDETKKKEERNEENKKGKGFFGKMKDAVEDLFDGDED